MIHESRAARAVSKAGWFGIFATVWAVLFDHIGGLGMIAALAVSSGLLLWAHVLEWCHQGGPFPQDTDSVAFLLGMVSATTSTIFYQHFAIVPDSFPTLAFYLSLPLVFYGAGGLVARRVFFHDGSRNRRSSLDPEEAAAALDDEVAAEAAVFNDARRFANAVEEAGYEIVPKNEGGSGGESA